jgi:hypothetical protein
MFNNIEIVLLIIAALLVVSLSACSNTFPVDFSNFVETSGAIG